MEEDYYYYDDDYVEKECESCESTLEGAYLEAKFLMDTNPAQCFVNLLAVAGDDSSGGKWAFKALKMLAKASRQSGAYEDMLRYYERVCTFNHRDVGKGLLLKAMTKFTDESHRIPAEYLSRVLRMTAEAASQDLKTFGRLWFDAKVKHAAVLLDGHNVEGVISEIEPVLAWCKQEGSFTFKKSAQLFSCHALQLEAYAVKGCWSKVRDIYFLTISVANTIAPSRVAGSVFECGGKMYVWYRDWSSSFQAFSAAFGYYNEGGDPRRVSCLKHLVLTCLLSGSDINLFAAQEVRAYEDVAEIVPFSRLMKAYGENDVQEFLGNLDIVRRSSRLEPTVLLCLDPLLDKLRLRALAAFAAPYERMYMWRLQEALLVEREEANRLCLIAVTEGILDAKLDSDRGAVMIRKGSTTGPECDRLLALHRWVSALYEINKKANKELERNM